MSLYSNKGVGDSLISAKWKKDKKDIGKMMFFKLPGKYYNHRSLKINKTACTTSVSKYTNVSNWYGFHWENIYTYFILQLY